MILSGDPPSHPTIHHRNRQQQDRQQQDRGGPASHWPRDVLADGPQAAVLLLAMAGAFACVPASACDGDAACGDINGFFMPLIANSLVDNPRRAAAAPVPSVTPDSILPAKPVVIRPPPRRGPNKPARPVPARRISLTQQLTTGRIAAGGSTFLAVDDDQVHIPATAADGASRATPDAALSPLRPVEGASGVWQARHMVTLPLYAAWPLGTLRQPVTMRLACGSCGKDGGVAHFTGKAAFEMTFDDFAEGWIEDIDLTSDDGLRASGDMSFWDGRPSRHLAVDHEAVMTLEIDGVAGELGGSLATWLGLDRRVAGMFTAVQIGDAAGFGGIAGQFRGDGCGPDCGVEN